MSQIIFQGDEIKEKDSDAEVSDTVEVSSLDDLYDDDSVDPVYRAKAHLLNKAVIEIGMGRYQVNTPNVFKLAVLKYLR